MSSHFDPILWSIGLALGLGLLSHLLAKKLHLTPILFFLFFGYIFGPEGLHWIYTEEFGSSFKTIISLGIAIILFEAGLTLDYSVYRKTSKIIWKLLTLGVAITWIGNALAIYFIFDLPFSFSIFASSLIIVTGPTVIIPILRRIQVNKKIFNILHWEGVLIDPIGVFIATLSFEVLLYWPSGGGITVGANLLLRIFFGTIFGISSGFLASQCIKRKWIPTDYINIFVLVMAIFTFSICDFFVSESGLLSTVIAGTITGYQKNIVTEEVKRFKLEITHLSVALLFILIVSSLDFSKIIVLGGKGILLLVIIILVIRPINVFCSSINSGLNLREKLFISWVAPRGIVAASMSTLFAFYLSNESQYNNIAWFAEALTFSVIFTTVLIQGLTVGPVARILQVKQQQNREWIIIGAHEFSEVLYRYLITKGYEVIIVDNNINRVDWLKRKGLNAINRDVLSSNVYSDERFFNSSTLISLTDNQDLNALICQHWRNLIHRENLFRWEKGNSQDGEESLIGQPIWDTLPSPSIISSEIIESKVQLIEKPYSERDEKNISLLYFYNNQVELKLDQDILDNPEEAKKVQCLFFCREGFKLHHFFKTHLVIFNESTHPHHLYSHLANQLEQFEKIDSQSLLKGMIAKHEDGSIALGKEAGIMHLLDSKVTKPILGVVISKNGFDINSYDKLFCKILFVLISPSGDPDRHVWIISTISQLFMSTNIKNRLIESKSQEEVANIISQHS